MAAAAGFRLPERPGGKSWLPLIALVVAVWVALSMFHQIGPKEQGIVTTFGKYSRTMTPGITFTLPWPIQQVDDRRTSADSAMSRSRRATARS